MFQYTACNTKVEHGRFGFSSMLYCRKNKHFIKIRIAKVFRRPCRVRMRIDWKFMCREANNYATTS
jgi:hypothetical protein